MFVAVLVLAGLQYRWLDGHRIWQQQQMKGYLQTLTRSAADRINTTFQTAVNALQLPSPGPEYTFSIEAERIVRHSKKKIDLFSSARQQFSSALADLDKDFSDLISRLYLFEDNRDRGQSICLYDDQTDSFRSHSPSHDLELFLEKLKSNVYELDKLRPLPQKMLLMDLPYIGIAAAPKIASAIEETEHKIAWTVIEIDIEKLIGNWLPQELQKTVPEADQETYTFSLFDLNKDKSLFSSGGISELENNSFDHREPLFCINSQVITRDADSGRVVVHGDDKNTIVQGEKSGLNIKEYDPQTGVLTSFSGGKSSFTYGSQIISVSKVADPRYKTLSGYYLSSRHKSGSIPRAAADAFYFNLLMSYSVFLLMLISFAVLIFAILKAREHNRQQNSFVNSISHELKTPLAIIRTAGENLKDNFVKNSEEVEYYGQVIYREGSRLHELVDQVLDYSGKKSGKSSLQLQDLPVLEIIERAIEDNRMLLEERGFDVSVNIPERDIRLRGDRHKLASAVKILISNALKYSGDSRRIEIEAHQKLQASYHYTDIIVRDFGIGIPLKEKDKIFQPFYRGDLVRETDIHGTGLGLSLAREIAGLHQGSLSFDSVEGRGSSFKITLRHRRQK